MKISLTRLENKKCKQDGRTTARCPACAADGGDKKGEHLVVFKNGKFGCVAFPDDKQHRSKILALVGDSLNRGTPRFHINKITFPEKKVLLKIGNLSSKGDPPPAATGDRDPSEQKVPPTS